MEVRTDGHYARNTLSTQHDQDTKMSSNGVDFFGMPMGIRFAPGLFQQPHVALVQQLQFLMPENLIIFPYVLHNGQNLRYCTDLTRSSSTINIGEGSEAVQALQQELD